MKVLGTIDEWLNLDPKAYLTNKNFVRQKGVAFHCIEKHSEPFMCSYPISSCPHAYDDTDNLHRTPFIYFGNQCPYIVKGSFTYSAGIVFYPSGAGASFPLSTEMVSDPNWERYEIEDYYEDIK